MHRSRATVHTVVLQLVLDLNWDTEWQQEAPEQRAVLETSTTSAVQETEL